MTKITLSSILLVIFWTSGCTAQQANQLTGTLQGTIGLYEGNCMPGPGIPPCEPRPISAWILITEVSETYNPNLLVDSVRSNAEGKYSIRLKEGSYSLFVRDGDQIVCTEIQCPDSCICHPFIIKLDSVTVIDANLDHATW
ncbi:MAG: hypothetical protein RLN88_04365 [Ekhidna sp.]|uniref:hypothetical protein n=1 Tax=Ekhidna sp. TaxID=2608089 RepID=UPI0032ED83BD